MELQKMKNLYLFSALLLSSCTVTPSIDERIDQNISTALLPLSYAMTFAWFHIQQELPNVGYIPECTVKYCHGHHRKQQQLHARVARHHKSNGRRGQRVEQPR